mmetsp:Transcript_16919/g.47221  ORF Transcript_16919/g.47221 Transcript_16919/m.47221 type:complete len:95 (-) Transcript_16919:213-497(-)
MAAASTFHSRLEEMEENCAHKIRYDNMHQKLSDSVEQVESLRQEAANLKSQRHTQKGLVRYHPSGKRYADRETEKRHMEEMNSLKDELAAVHVH